MRKYHECRCDTMTSSTMAFTSIDTICPVPNKYDRTVVVMFEAKPYIIFPKQ